MSLTDLNRSIWQSPYQLNTGVTLRGPRRHCYTWDMYHLAEDVGTDAENNYRTVAMDSEFWNVCWLSNYSDDAGSGIVKPLNSIQTVNSFNHYQATANFFKNNFSFSPRIGEPYPIPQPEVQLSEIEADTGYNEFSEAERVIYELSTIPAYPILVSTTVPNHKTYGPLFLASANYSVSGENRPGDVNISITLQGGKSIRLDEHEVKNADLVDQNPPPNPDTVNQNPVYEYRKYRNANMVDCLAGFIRATSETDFRDKASFDLFLEKKSPIERIIEMSLNISQNIKFRATTPEPPKTDDHGPRFVEIDSFNVSGSLKFYSREQKFATRTGELSLYFGGTFLFSMQSVDYNWVTLNLSTEHGYLHEVQFVARAPKNMVTRPYLDGGDGLPVSQFDPQVQSTN